MSTDLGAVSSWVAAVVSTVSTLIAVWKAWYWRPTPQWTLQPTRLTFSLIGALSGHPYGAGIDPHEQIAIQLVNVGDGTALDVTVECEQCVARFVTVSETDSRGIFTRQRIAHIPPAGEAVLIVLPQAYLNEDSALLERSRGVPPEDVRVTISWTVPPARARRRRQRTLVIAGESLRFEGKTRRTRMPFNRRD